MPERPQSGARKWLPGRAHVSPVVGQGKAAPAGFLAKSDEEQDENKALRHFADFLER